MIMLEIKALDNGAHSNQTYHGVLPDGWAIVRDGESLENFPFGSFEVEEIDGVVYMKSESWVAGEIPVPEEDTFAHIAELKEQLAATDYKIVKCSEHQLAGLELPYDIETLHAERQAIRDAINELESV